MATYNSLERPVSNESESLEVKFGLTLQQIIDVVSNCIRNFHILQFLDQINLQQHVIILSWGGAEQKRHYRKFQVELICWLNNCDELWFMKKKNIKLNLVLFLPFHYTFKIFLCIIVGWKESDSDHKCVVKFGKWHVPAIQYKKMHKKWATQFFSQYFFFRKIQTKSGRKKI